VCLTEDLENFKERAQIFGENQEAFHEFCQEKAITIKAKLMVCFLQSIAFSFAAPIAHSTPGLVEIGITVAEKNNGNKLTRIVPTD
jgi:hypothetical protein